MFFGDAKTSDILQGVSRHAEFYLLDQLSHWYKEKNHHHLLFIMIRISYLDLYIKNLNYYYMNAIRWGLDWLLFKCYYTKYVISFGLIVFLNARFLPFLKQCFFHFFIFLLYHSDNFRVSIFYILLCLALALVFFSVFIFFMSSIWNLSWPIFAYRPV